jgi:exopolyphosphatase/guanosine-5'-triphosphate,3'-diphosphate pyrophosphatase
MEDHNNRIAVIDLGTNTFHLVLAKINDLGFEIEEKKQIVVKLAVKSNNLKQILPDAFQRGIFALEEFSQILKKYKPSKVVAVGTSALRNAENAINFIEEGSKALGYEIVAIDGDKEAELIYKGVAYAVPITQSPNLIMDIGGGSVEFIICNRQGILWKKSFETGAARLIDKFSNELPWNDEQVKSCIAYLESMWNELWMELEKYKILTLIGASGAFDSFVSVEFEKWNKLESKYNYINYVLNFDRFQDFKNLVFGSNFDSIAEIEGMHLFRVEMIMSAVLMIDLIIKKTNPEYFIASDYSLKEGLLLETIALLKNKNEI